MTELDESHGVGRDGLLVDALRADLAAASFTVPAIESLLGPLASSALDRDQPLAALRATDRPGDLATLARLFVLGAEVNRDELDQALHASRHCRSVVATDISRRALSFATFNAALARVEVDLRAGSMLAPVRGQTFDLVVSNPLFFSTPGAVHDAGLPRYDYREAAAAGDDVVRDLVHGVGTVLAPGGVAQSCSATGSSGAARAGATRSARGSMPRDWTAG
jgi:SAM-dependent methyltransferase